MVIPEESLFDIGKHPGGINNIDSETGTPVDMLREALNVDLSRDGTARRRKGYTKRQPLVDGHSLYANDHLALVVSDGQLCRIQEEGDSLTPIVPVGGKVVYEAILNSVYFTDGKKIGRINHDGSYQLGWIANPEAAPTLAYSETGSLPPGKYQVAITHVTVSGKESGTELVMPIELVNPGGIVLSDLPQPMGMAATRIYLTHANGEVFYRHMDLPAGLTSVAIKQVKTGKELDTLFAEPLPPGTALCSHFGRLYVATGEVLYYSVALRSGLTRRMDNYFSFPGEQVVLVMRHSTGLYVVTDASTYFLQGTNPEEMSLRLVYPHGGVPGTSEYVPSSVLGVEFPGDTPVWFGDTGYVAGGPDGFVQPLNERNVTTGKYLIGAVLYREEAGLRQLIAATQYKMEHNRLETSDSLSFEIRRNTITTVE